MGFRGHSLQYLKSYLTDRKQYVQVGDFKSEMSVITMGVPQGSILGPLLFCLFLNDIVFAVDQEVILFADDAAFFISAPTLQELENKIKKMFVDLNKYLKANRLIPNLSKSKLMFFDTRPIPELPDILFDGHKIEWVEEYKYLGLTLSNKMTYSLHINSVISKISRFNGTFYKLRQLLPVSTLKMLFSSFVLPHVMQHIVIWGATPPVYMNKLRIKINVLLRTILNVKYHDFRPEIDTCEIYKRLDVLKVENIFKLRLFKLLTELLRGLQPEFYDLLLKPFENNHL
ncbi:MAG: reverse transcriptase domain-containing protein, partial [Cyanobacteria bacterium J06614_10]